MKTSFLIFLSLTCQVLFAQISDVQKADFIFCTHEALNKNDFETAIDLYSTLLLINPIDTESYFERAVIYSDFGDDKSAIKDFTTCLAMDSSNIDCFFLRGICYKNLGELNRAESDLKKANTMEPNNADLHMHYGDVLVALKRYDDAVSEYTKALDLKSDNTSEIFYQLAQIALLQKKKDEYLNNLKKSLDANIANAPAASAYIIHLLEKSELAEALKYLLRMLHANQEMRYDVQTFAIPVSLQKECFQRILNESARFAPNDSIDRLCLQAKAFICFGSMDAAKNLMKALPISDDRVKYVSALICFMEKDYAAVMALSNTFTDEFALRFSSLRLSVFKELQNKKASCEELQKIKKLQHRYFEASMCDLMN